MSEDPLIASLTAALEARPADVPLRVHLAGLLLAAGRSAEAIGQAAVALQHDPGSADAQGVMQRALGGPAPAAPSTPAPDDDPLRALEAEMADVFPPRFVGGPGAEPADHAAPQQVAGDGDRMFDVERSALTLADVGGMTEVKERLELAFLAPMRNPQLRAMYGKSLRGGLLMYGPPGCGKTHLARAVAGELGAGFLSLTIVDVLDMWIGSSERSLHELFQQARRNAPCVLFLDEIDALGGKRSKINSHGMRTVVNQLLSELDGVDSDNEGVFVLAATNAPWDVDAALRRPGRLDRTLLVLPPDAAARSAILQYHLRERPIASINLDQLVAGTEHFSGADLAHLCDSAAEYAMHDSIRSGQVRMIEHRDFERALRDVSPSIGPWLETARNVALFANTDGTYDELAKYLKARNML
ncbi:ATP-binding protein [Longispora albida]|uniref:ATP-binding protein n=1 Tax=Longispora albida TaxID=203523 RepID=UPI000360D426|nr:AAA family ATPase [Longispora albida]